MEQIDLNMSSSKQEKFYDPHKRNDNTHIHICPLCAM